MMPLITVDKQARQLSMEAMYSRTNIQSKVRGSILASPALVSLMSTAVLSLEEYRTKDYHYITKNLRVKDLATLDLTELVLDIMCTIIQISKPELFTSVVGRLTGCLKFAHKQDAVKTISEILAIMAIDDLFDILTDDYGTMTIQSSYELDSRTQEFISRTQYLPPMVCEPMIVENNHDSGYLSIKGSLLLGAGNHHDGNICLDSINKFNQVALSLDLELLKWFEELPNAAFKDSYSTKEGKWVSAREKQKGFDKMKSDSLHVYAEIAANGNKFWLTHKKDKRGRSYSQGYHITTQGTKFKKAIINFHKKEIVSGAPQRTTA